MKATRPRMLRFRVSSVEEERIRAAADQQNLSMSAWVRQLLLRELNKQRPVTEQDDDHAW